MEAPYSLASLPKPLDESRGRISASTVHGIRAGKKRKRHEIAVGVDGEGVNIYNVQNQSLVTSYAFAPQTYLCRPPASLHVRPGPGSATRRDTFLLVKESPDSTKIRLTWIRESGLSRAGASQSNGLGVAKPAIKQIDVACTGRPVSLDIHVAPQHAPLAEDEELGSLVVVSFANGEVWTYDTASHRSWQGKGPDVNGSLDLNVAFATLLDVETAREGLLKMREDVLARLDPSTQIRNGTNTALLCHIVRAAGTPQLKLYSLQTPVKDSVQTWKTGMELLMSYELPISHKSDVEDVQCDLHPSSGTLYQLSRGRLSVVDLSSTFPRKVVELGRKQPRISSFARVTATTVLAISDNTAILYETTFGSQLASLVLNAPTGTEQGSKKRKRGDLQDISSFIALGAFVDLGLAIGLSGHELKALQISKGLTSLKRTAKRTLLVDMMGKGVTAELEKKHKSEKKAISFENWQAKVDLWVDQNEMESLEALLIEDDKLGLWEREGSLAPEESDSDVDNPMRGYEEIWPAVGAQDLQNIDQRKATYLLKKTFAKSSRDGERLMLCHNSRKILIWLTSIGQMTIENVQKVVPEVQLVPGDIALALKTISDGSTTTALWTLMSLPVHWDIAELVQGLKILLDDLKAYRDFRNSEELQGLDGAIKSLTAGAMSKTAESEASDDSESLDGPDDVEDSESFDAPEGSRVRQRSGGPREVDDDVEMANGDAEDQLQREAMAAVQTAVQALGPRFEELSSRLEEEMEALRTIFWRLHDFPPKVITSTMRSMLGQEDLVAVIELMRNELVNGGWTASYTPTDGGEVDDETNLGLDSGDSTNDAIKVIGDLLNCAIDAIGLNGWMVGLSGHEDHVKLLVRLLKAEVNACLEGCYGAVVVGEFLSTMQKRSHPSQRRPPPEEGLDAAQAMLPMGGRFEPLTAPDRDGKKGKKSRIALAQEKSRTVGKYSIERIRV